MAKSFDDRYADFRHRLAKAFPLTQGYYPKGKELNKLKSKRWRKRMEDRFKRMTGGK